MPTSSPMKKTIDIQANASTPHGATIRLTVEYRIRPPKVNERGPVWEGVDMKQNVNVNMGDNGRYNKESNYSYGNFVDRSPQYPATPIKINQEKTNEQSSEDEKSTSSEEVFFEEWTEQFPCRRTDEYDRQTNQLIRTTIDETGDRIKGDVIKEQYKEKNTRIKSRNNKDKHRTSTHVYEEISQPPLPPSRQWTSEEVYTAEIAAVDSSPPIQHKQNQEQIVTEEYHVEFETPKKTQTDTSIEQLPIPNTPIRQSSDWKSELKDKYSPPSDNDQYKTSNNGNYHAQRVSVIPANNQQQRFKEVKIKVPGQEKTTSPSEQRTFSSSTPSSSRHRVKEVLVCISRNSSPEKQSHDDKRSKRFDSQTPNRSTSVANEPTYSRVGELKTAFETNKFQTPIKTEQRQRMFDEQEWTPKTVAERRLSETHTAPSIVSERVSHIENRTGFEVTPQTSIDTRYKPKQVISSIDSEISGPARPIYQSTPKSTKQKLEEDPGHESEDELSDSNQPNHFRRRSSKTRYRDFTQTTSQPIESTHTVQRIISKFNESNVENVLSHVPSSKGKGILIELSQTPSKSNLASDSGIFENSTWRQNVSTSIADDVTHSRDNGIYVDSTNTTHQYQPQRTVRRQLTNTSREQQPQDYEYLTNYQSQIPITTQSRTIKPYVVDEIETIETKTQVECNIQRTNQTNESTKTERATSTSPSPTHQSPLKTTLQTNTTIQSPQETLHARRVLLNERPQYYQPSTQFQPIKHDYSNEDLSSINNTQTQTQTMHVTSLSPTHQVTFGKSSPNEVIAIVRVPELTQRYERPQLHYQRVYASSYRPPTQQRPSRYESRNDYSTPMRSASYHRNLHEEQEQQQRQSPQYQTYSPITRYHSNSLGNLFGQNLEFEIEIEKRPPQQPEQPTSVSLDQPSRAIITTSKDGRVSIQNVAAYPGHTVVINSDYHASDRSLNRSSGYFSSSDDQSSAINNYSLSHFNQINDIVSRSSANFHDTIDQIDALYNNLDVQTNNQHAKINRRRQLVQNPNEYSKRFTSTGFQQQPTMTDQDPTISNLLMSTPIRPSQSLSSSGILTDYGTPGSISPPSHYSSRQNLIVQQNRLNNQSQIVQRNRTSVKQMKQKNAAKRRNGNNQGQFSDDDEDDESDGGHPSRVYHFQ